MNQAQFVEQFPINVALSVRAGLPRSLFQMRVVEVEDLTFPTQFEICRPGGPNVLIQIGNYGSDQGVGYMVVTFGHDPNIPAIALIEVDPALWGMGLRRAMVGTLTGPVRSLYACSAGFWRRLGFEWEGTDDTNKVRGL